MHRSPYTRASDISSNLLAPLRLGRFHLSHRVVLAPVTRCRAINYVPQPAHCEFYSERATEGGLLITEAVAVSQAGIGFPHSPGIWSDEQVEAWRKVVKSVHKKGGIIFCQLWHVGRASHTYYQPERCIPVSSTARRLPKNCLIRLPEGEMAEYSQPRSLSTEEIPLIIEEFRVAARNARRAGFDGVEIHGGHGYLVDQFFKDGINDRTDVYGGSIENRCRFALEVIHAVASQMGEKRTAIRISPVIDHLGAVDSNPDALFFHLMSELNRKRLAYVHMTEPRFNNKGADGLIDTTENCSKFREAYDGLLMLSGGFTRESGMEAIRSGAADMVSYGRLFISNPDLALRFAIEASLNAYDRSTFYTHDQYVGYLDYPKLKSEEIRQGWSKQTQKKKVRSGIPHHPKLNIQPLSSTMCGRMLASPLAMRASPHSHVASPQTPLLVCSPSNP
ncbi:hypothetical protein KP509_30G037300 [Ceratopteris richardii]|uniref:NADH:flavin oxidoreductase/NADH oxidase N-terminal domain-containing protein n=1 Tax=Ceratopteris richardii TaxID=49495 RepID=A0A8T2R3Q2_CERRI|nr:hypothetical protein KP509_30G037300 [Ceratopteris richardii]